MAILAECPFCHRKQANKNRKCQSCGADLIKAKRSERVKYWITYRIDRKQRRESVGFSLADAQAAEGKRKSQKRECRVLEILPESKITFSELQEWYLGLESVKSLRAYNRVGSGLRNFNRKFGGMEVMKFKLQNLEEYQAMRLKKGLSPKTVEMEIKFVQTLVIKAFDNDKIESAPLKAFRKIKSTLKKGANARKRKLSLTEYNKLLAVSPMHLKNYLIMGMNTGMRLGEIRELKWADVDQKSGFIRLGADETKEEKEKNIPINHNVQLVLDSIIHHIDHDYIFTYQGRHINRSDGISYALASACKKAGIQYGRKKENGFTFHDIRRTVKSNMLAAHVSKTYRDVILGHSLKGMDVHYITPDENELKQAMEQYTTWLDSETNKLKSVDQNVDQAKKKGQPAKANHLRLLKNPTQKSGARDENRTRTGTRPEGF